MAFISLMKAYQPFPSPEGQERRAALWNAEAAQGSAGSGVWEGGTSGAEGGRAVGLKILLVLNTCPSILVDLKGTI